MSFEEYEYKLMRKLFNELTPTQVLNLCGSLLITVLMNSNLREALTPLNQERLDTMVEFIKGMGEVIGPVPIDIRDRSNDH